MKKNNKGFTLIELMAVIVIMGILSIIVIPRISDLVLETKEEIYVQDARKLLTQAQYRMNSNSVDIDKPEMDECIVFSLKYLNINDFRSPPNNGSYMDESSFVVVRNVDGDYQYAVMLLEHRKDGLYQGVEFVTEKQLNARDAIKHVRYFEPRDIRYIDPDVSEKAGGDYIDTQYINSQLAKSGVGQSKWVEDNSIVGTYNEMAMKEGLVADASSPKFTAKITSDEERDEIGTIYAVLTVSASDADDALNTLTVCTKVADRDDLDYPVNSLTPELCESYGDRKYFVKNIDFAQYGFNNRDKTLAYVYVTVMDPGGNVTRKLIEYNIHQNPGPRIRQMVLTKRSEDKQNLPTATLHVTVWDDLYSPNQLTVCFNQDIDEETCQGEFKPYNEVFDSNNQLNYTFKDPNGVNMVNPDGSNHTLTMFVKNPDDLISKKTAEYLIYINQDPVIEKFSVIPDTIDGFNSLYYHVELNASDDLDVSNLMVRLGNEEPIRFVEFRSKESNAGGKAIHRAPGLFDGKDREIVVKVWDQYQTEEDAVFTNAFITNVYLNEPPYVSEATITSSGKICMEGGKCASNVDTSLGGAYSANVKLKAADSLLSDIRSFKDNVKICISEDYNYCAEYQKDHFVDYTENLTYKFSSPTGDDMYGQPDTRNLYIALLEKEVYRDETNYYYSISDGFSYKIYENQEPIITYHNSEKSAFDVITTEPKGDHVKKVNINFDNMVINDDFTYYTLQYCYTIDGGNPICTDSLSRTDFQETFRKPFTYVNADGSDLGLMNGQEIVSYVVVTDHQGKVAKSGEVTYALMTDQKPSIEEVTLGSDNIEFNSKNLRISFKVLDVGDTYTVCFKEKINDNDTCGPDDYTIMDNGKPFSGDRRGTDTAFYPISYSGQHWSYKDNPNTKTFIFSVKDSQGKVTDYSEQHSDPLTYDLYIACQPGNVTIGNISYYPKDTQSAINITNCSGKCYHSLPTIPINSSLYSQINGYSSIYNKHMDNIVDNFLNNTDDLCPAIDEDETKYCNYESCFNHDSTVINPLFIGISELPENPTPYTVYLTGQFQTVEVNEQCPSLIKSGKLLFSKSDNRCTSPDETCSGYDDEEQCKLDLAKFCDKDDSEAMYAVSCANATDDDIVRRTCKRDYLNGDCYESATCTPQDHCMEKCYKPIDCAEHIVTINNPTVTCNKGVYSIYKAKSISNLEQGKIALVSTYPSTCPEALEAFPEYYAYDPNSPTPFVWFNLDELRENTTINVDVYFNGSE